MTELEKHACALYLCKDMNNPPKQHIFWVDDVWFHGDSSDSNKPKKCHFAGECNSIDATICEEKKLHWHGQKYIVSTDLRPVWNSLCPHPVNLSKTTGEKVSSDDEGAYKGISHQEADIAKKEGLTEDELIPILAQFASDNDYGLVLCSFEFFFLHREEIAKHCEHAAIFDVRHQAAEGKTDLITAWNTGLAAPKINDLFNRCGYRLYLELAKCCQSHPNGFSIERHACFLTSKEGFHDHYLEDLIAMIQTNALSKAVHLLRPLVLSKSKLGGSSALLHSLELFNTSFRYALSWEMKELALWEDMKQLWGNPQTNEDWGHIQSGSIPTLALKSTAWLPASDQDKARCLQAMYLAVWRVAPANALAVSAFHAFLDHAADPSTVVFNKPGSDLDGKFVSLPCRPGILSVLAIARFLRSLTQKKGNEHRATPVVSWSKDAQKVKLHIKLPGVQAGVDSLKIKFLNNESTTGSTPALRQVAAAQLLMLDATTSKDSTKLGNISYSGITLRERLCQDADHEHLPLPKALPSFNGDTITFWFQVVETPPAG